MKTAFIVLFTLISLSIFAQDCNTSLLFKKGAELSYKTYQGLGGFLKLEYTETTQLTFSVRDVKDSNNIKYSYITKTGTNPKSPNQKYEKNYILTCDGNKISIPAGFYIVDTVYMSNVFTGSKDKGFFSTSTFNETYQYTFPLNFDKTSLEPPFAKSNVVAKMRSYDRTPEGVSGGNFTGHISESTITVEATIEKYEADGTEMITVPAGNYKCNKIVTTLETTSSMVKRTTNSTSNIYYSQEAGIVKTEERYGKKVMSYTELNMVKK